MLAVLPKRSSDDVSGELFVAAYQKKLGHYCDDAVSFLADKAMERCQWFPTIHECIEILGDWRRHDKHTKRRMDAYRVIADEERARNAERMSWHSVERDQLTQAAVDEMSPGMQRIGLSCGALVEWEGKVIPLQLKPGDGF